MSVINEQVFCDIVAGNKGQDLKQDLANNLFFIYHNRSDARSPLPVDRAGALALLDQVKQVITTHASCYSKLLRPHDFDDFSYLDRSKPWWGFEFETGWQSSEVRRQACEAAWEMGVNGVTFDREGEGAYEVEITFAPSEMDNFLDGTAPAYEFMKYLNEHPEDIFRDPFEESVGTHINISLPQVVTAADAAVLNNSLFMLPTRCDINGRQVNTRRHFFGRESLYGGFYGRASHSHAWLEGKLFRTTYYLHRFLVYIQAARTLTKLLSVVSEHPSLRDAQIGASNLLEMMLDPEVEPEFVRNVDFLGTGDRDWVSGMPSNSSYYEMLGGSTLNVAVTDY